MILRQSPSSTLMARVVKMSSCTGAVQDGLPMARQSSRLLQGGFGLFLLEQGEEIPIGQGWGPNYGYSVSPDSRCVCFGMNEGLAVGVVDWPNKKMQVRVLLDNGHCGHTSWSPDSKRVAFAWEKEAGKPMQIYTLDVEGKDPPVRVKNQPEDRSNMDVDWSPDGKWLVFASQVFTE